MSWFGGPNDKGMAPAEGLALVNQGNLQLVSDYFLPVQPPGTTGLGRRLNPDKFYLACRWDYHRSPQETLLGTTIKVTNPKSGKSAMAKPVDWGPNEKTGRVADLSPGLCKELGLETDDICEVDY